MTRGRQANTAYLTEQPRGDTDHQHSQPGELHVMSRGTTRHAAHLVRTILANDRDQARTAHDVAADTADRSTVPDRVAELLDRRSQATRHRRTAHQRWRDSQLPIGSHSRRLINRDHNRDAGSDIDI